MKNGVAEGVASDSHDTSGDNLLSLVGIGLTDLPNIGEASGPPGPPGSGTTDLHYPPLVDICEVILLLEYGRNWIPVTFLVPPTYLVLSYQRSL